MKPIIGVIEAKADYPHLGLERGHEYNNEFSQELKQIFTQYKYAIEVFIETHPREIELYVEKQFGKHMFAIRNNCTYVANTNTSDTWVRAEWYLVSGIENYIDGQSYLLGNEVYNLGAIYKAKANTSDIWILSEWDLVLQGA